MQASDLDMTVVRVAFPTVLWEHEWSTTESGDAYLTVRTRQKLGGQVCVRKEMLDKPQVQGQFNHEVVRLRADIDDSLLFDRLGHLLLAERK